MEPRRDGDIELHKGRYCDVGLCIGVGGGRNGGVGRSVGVDGTGVWVVVGVLVVATVVMQEVLVEVVSGASRGRLLVVVVALDGFGLVPWSGWRVVL